MGQGREGRQNPAADMVVARCQDSICLASAIAAAADIAAGRISSEELTRACLDRIAERESEVRAWAWLSPEQAIAEACARDREPRRGLLHGIPVAVKDIIDTVDMPTEYGTPIYRGHRPRRDS